MPKNVDAISLHIDWQVLIPSSTSTVTIKQFPQKLFHSKTNCPSLGISPLYPFQYPGNGWALNETTRPLITTNTRAPASKSTQAPVGLRWLAIYGSYSCHNHLFCRQRYKNVCGNISQGLNISECWRFKKKMKSAKILPFFCDASPLNQCYLWMYLADCIYLSQPSAPCQTRIYKSVCPWSAGHTSAMMKLC